MKVRSAIGRQRPTAPGSYTPVIEHRLSCLKRKNEGIEELTILVVPCFGQLHAVSYKTTHTLQSLTEGVSYYVVNRWV